MNKKRVFGGWCPDLKHRAEVDNKRFVEEYKNYSYMNSPSNSPKNRENDSKNLIGQQIMAYFFNKMKMNLIQQNKIFKNFALSIKMRKQMQYSINWLNNMEM